MINHKELQWKKNKKSSYFYRISRFVRASNKTEEREKEKRTRKTAQPRPTDAAVSARRGSDFTRWQTVIGGTQTSQEGSISPHACVVNKEINHSLNTSSCNNNDKPLIYNGEKHFWNNSALSIHNQAVNKRLGLRPKQAGLGRMMSPSTKHLMIWIKCGVVRGRKAPDISNNCKNKS